MSADDIPTEAWENSVTFPLAEEPEHTATIRVESKLYSRASLYSMLKMVSAAAVPVKVEYVFGCAVPPPIFVTVEDAAQCLAVPVKHVKSLILHGWLSPVHHQDHQRRTGKELTRALETDQWPGWELRIIWTELVALAEWCKRNRHIPTYDPPPDMRRWIGGHVEKGSYKVNKNRAGLTRQILRDAREADGSQGWVSLRTLHQMVQEIDPDAPYATVQNAVVLAKKKGYCRSREYRRADDPRMVMHDGERRHKVADDRFGDRGRAVLYQWIPEDERRERSWEKPLGTLENVLAGGEESA